MASLTLKAAALAALALVPRLGVRATTIERPPCLDPFQPFIYSGCYADTGNPHALSLRSQLDQQNMTIEKCVSVCKGNGFRYAGLEYYGVCYCGNTVNGQQLAEASCNYPCTSNSSQVCGGTDIISIYQDPTFLPVDEVTVADYDHLGCWTDDSEYGKALAYPQDQLDGSTLTTEKCLEACREGGYPLAGAEFGGECWCGVVIGNGTFSAPDTECDIPCNGKSTQTCGGRARLNLYVANELQSLEPCGYVPPPPGSSSTSSSSTTSVASSSSTLDVTTSTTTTSDIPSSNTASYTLSSTTTTSTSTTLATTTSLPRTTTSTTVSTTTTSSICKETVTLPPTCEYKCGKWCSSPLPDWDSPQSCFTSHANCFLQVSACFKQAGWPGALECFGFAEWCSALSTYCKGSGRPGGICSKKDFWDHKPPSGPRSGVPTTTVITVPCLPINTGMPPTATSTKPATSTSTQCPIPTSTSLCNPPKNNKPPVGGIPLPVVTCNDLLPSFNSGHPFKLYTDSDSSKCKSYARSSFSTACLDACQEQYEDCVDVYAKGCKEGKYKEDSMRSLEHLNVQDSD
ncbi:WSC domain-containing protein [Pseudoneurospora amorphoporcata]|uniref:WSC domain-containing protein n=1 Tax=Pseudoneurospora amorphoporcata TaxID=241081 RepID=A0AAN6NSQ8_9PEZI|nr:WSC domain-containing protein [Pseudoneurospora amorphoporcata]